MQPGCQSCMKRFLGWTGVSRSDFCLDSRAGPRDRFGTAETDYHFSHRSDTDETTQQIANSVPRRFQTRNHRSCRLTQEWRVSYYAHAALWWPNALGE